jgi:uncharacterized protein (DUF697 family)
MNPTARLAGVWRIVREVDLHAIRESAERDFVLLVLADQREDAELVRRLLGARPGSDEPDAAILTAPADLDVGAFPVRPAAVVCVARGSRPSDALGRTRRLLKTRKVPVVTVVIDAGAAVHDAPSPGRLVLRELDASTTEPLAEAVVGALDPDDRVAVARQLPALRPAVFHVLTDETARANASFAFTTGLAEAVPVLSAPLNIGDVIVLTKNQLVMSYRMALAAGRDGEPRHLVGEILGVVGGGLLFRQIARGLVGLIPIIGLVPKVAVAYGGTWTIGRAMVAWLTEGRTLTSDALKSLRTEGLARGREVARRLMEARKRPKGDAGSEERGAR